MNNTIEFSQAKTHERVPSAEWSDEELLVAYRDEENRPAFEELVHRYERELYNYLRHYLGNAEMAEDAFQTTFLQVHLKCDRFDATRKVRPWLYTVATNQAIDAQRRNRRHRMVSLDRRSSSSEDEMGSLITLLDSPEPGPMAHLESNEARQTVRQAVDQLSDSFREVLILVYYQGLKYREAAEVLAIPVGTVKSRLHAAIGKLNEALTPTHLAGHG